MSCLYWILFNLIKNLILAQFQMDRESHNCSSFGLEPQLIFFTFLPIYYWFNSLHDFPILSLIGWAQSIIVIIARIPSIGILQCFRKVVVLRPCIRQIAFEFQSFIIIPLFVLFSVRFKLTIIFHWIDTAVTNFDLVMKSLAFSWFDWRHDGSEILRLF